MFGVNTLWVPHWVVVADEDQVLVLPPADGALVQWVNDAHVGLLLEAQQAVLVELHAVTPVGADANHRPYHQSDLRNTQENVNIKESF